MRVKSCFAGLFRDTPSTSATARLAVAASLALGLCSPRIARAADATLTLQPDPPPGVWQDTIGDGFREDTFDAGLSLGAGAGAKVFGTTEAHDVALASGHFGWIFTGVVAGDYWWRGNWEWLNEFFSGGQFSPQDRYFLGWTTGLRYNFATGSRWVPYIDGGVGLSGTDIEQPDLDGTFQFNVQVGLGTQYFLTDRSALTLQYRWLHFSDGGTTSPNRGVNVETLLAGLTWFF